MLANFITALKSQGFVESLERASTDFILARGRVLSQGQRPQPAIHLPERGDIVEKDGLLLFNHAWPSQEYLSSFIIDGILYNCTQQYMMAEKARFFGDPETLRKILNTDSPKEQKALGRKVKNFNAKAWDVESKKVVYNGNYARFSQNPYQTRLILNTGTKRLVQATPDDKIWGIGLPPNSPAALEPKNWLGKNQLGDILMKVRHDLSSTVVK